MALLFASCFTTGCRGPSTAAPDSLVEAEEAPLPAEPQDEATRQAFEIIAQAEYARSNLRVLPYAESESPAVRARSMEALGRIADRAWPASQSFSHLGATRVLRRGLFDSDPAVRRAAAFALGLNGHTFAGPFLLQVALDPTQEENLRILCLEAASKLPDPSLIPGLLSALNDESSVLRAQAAVAAHRIAAEGEGAKEINQALLGALNLERDPEVIWRLLFSLERRGATEAREELTAQASSQSTLARMFAVKGLARVEGNEQTRAAMLQACGDADWRIACEAVAGLCMDEAAELPPMLFQHPNPHVRRTAYEGLARRHSPGSLVLPTLETLQRERSPSVQAAMAEVMLAHSRPGGEPLARALIAASPRASTALRCGIVRGVGRLPDEAAVPMLIELTSDDDVRVAGTAIEALARHPMPESRRALWRVLDMQDGDNGLKLAAVLALAEMPAVEDLSHLERAFQAQGDIATELRFNVLRGTTKIVPLGGESAVRALLALGFADPHPFVRRTASQQWATIAPTELPPTVPPLGEQPEEPQVPVSAGDASPGGPNPWATIETSRGRMLFELFPAEAPVHVYNFAWLAERDHYDGLLFHRVVPNFVIQGGDYRRDGNGGVTWNDHPLPCEIGPRRFVRGSLGMPRNDDWDSGGSQFFVTHRPTPHLDGRYTIFGELREGFDVLDAIEVDDAILDVRIHEALPGSAR